MGTRGRLKLIDVTEGYEESAILWTAVIGAKVSNFRFFFTAIAPE